VAVFLAAEVKLYRDFNYLLLALASTKDLITLLAAEYVELPAWLAVIEQVPAETAFILLPLTIVQTAGVVEVKRTERSAVLVADIA
jgi:hypothetical protein